MSEIANTVLIEADSVESALEKLTEEFGPGATIVSAERVRRGGLAGFFATEGIELVAIPQTGATEAPAAEPQPNPPQQVEGVDNAFARLLAAAEIGDASPVMPTQLNAGNPAVTTITPPEVAKPVTPTPAPPSISAPLEMAKREAILSIENPTRSGQLELPFGTEPEATVVLAPQTSLPSPTGRRWDLSSLINAGLPAAFISELTSLDPSDDIAHITTIARRVEPLTGVIPGGTHKFLGSRWQRLQAATDLTDGDGPLHLVLDGTNEEFTTARPPQIISWTDESAAPRAIALAIQTGAVLGWGMSSTFGARANRMTPVDAALAIRNLLEQS